MVVGVQAAKVDENTLQEWVKEHNISCVVGRVAGDVEGVLDGSYDGPPGISESGWGQCSPGFSGRIDNQPGHIIDIMPTLADLCGAEYPAFRNGKPAKPLQGISLWPVFKGKRLARKDPLYWEHVGNRGVRIGDWKLVAAKPKLSWELYNLREDRAELHDLSDRLPEKKQELLAAYERWARDNRVMPWPRK